MGCRKQTGPGGLKERTKCKKKTNTNKLRETENVMDRMTQRGSKCICLAIWKNVCVMWAEKGIREREKITGAAVESGKWDIKTPLARKLQIGDAWLPCLRILRPLLHFYSLHFLFSTSVLHRSARFVAQPYQRVYYSPFCWHNHSNYNMLIIEMNPFRIEQSR